MRYRATASDSSSSSSFIRSLFPQSYFKLRPSKVAPAFFAAAAAIVAVASAAPTKMGKTAAAAAPKSSLIAAL